jgi:hypothetical protein
MHVTFSQDRMSLKVTDRHMLGAMEFEGGLIICTGG